ncbi:MAG: hypothetical protein WD768_04250 [Phycisphaeraceae bacterium]
MRIGPAAVLSISLGMLSLLSTPAAAQDGKTVAAHWENFVHYVRIAKPDLALAEATFLLQQASEAELLAAVENSRVAETYLQVLERAAKTETLKDAATKLAKKIQDARFKLAREAERIKQDIQKLAQGERARGLALDRLRVAGQFASKELLSTLLNGDETKLHPYVLAAMVTIGRGMVYPLSEALADLEPVPMGQVAEVLGQIGYPLALPYLKRVMESSTVDSHARSIVTLAYNRILKSAALPENITAAELFLLQAQRYYTAVTNPNASLYGIDEVDNTGVIWTYSTLDKHLHDVHVPPQVFGDVLAHRAARNALQLQPDMDAALSVWLAANLRRENRLGGDKDSSYPPSWHPPIFYLKASHPRRSHDVLERALLDGDPDLARDAINALQDIAGTIELINESGTIQPMLKGLSYPDRRVRYEVAFALTNARPKEKYTGSFRVVPVLAEAVRQTENRYALVIASSEEELSKIKVALDKEGYQSFGALSLEQAVDELTLKPGVDLLITNLDPAGVSDLYEKTIVDYKLAAVPFVVMARKVDAPGLGRTFDGNRRVLVTEATAEGDQLKGAAELARSSYAGKEIAADEAAKYASTSLALLRELSISRAEVYSVLDALPALTEAVNKDSRQEIVKQAGGVLAVLDQPDAQKTLAAAALDENRPEDTRISLLGSLAESATHFGVRISNIQLENLHQLVDTAQGQLAIAAARAYGALAQPTSKVVDFIVK